MGLSLFAGLYFDWREKSLSALTTVMQEMDSGGFRDSESADRAHYARQSKIDTEMRINAGLLSISVLFSIGASLFLGIGLLRRNH